MSEGAKDAARVAAREADQRAEDRFDRVARWFVFAVFLALAFAYTLTLHAQQVSAVLYIQRIEPTPAMAAMYHEVEACVGHRGSFRRIKWYAATAPWTDAQRGKTWGLWSRHRGRAQIIAVGADTAILRHEMLHDVLDYTGWKAHRTPADSGSNLPEHPLPWFDQCARRFFPSDYKLWGRE